MVANLTGICHGYSQAADSCVILGEYFLLKFLDYQQKAITGLRYINYFSSTLELQVMFLTLLA